ncbi:hypothetical protein MesoLj131c_62500 [Mesorhizobium sp. 131-3-5]|uniref:hypothetical protein n=1 Tax=Mesorhizobium sp. 131-3-5 TaxID=2744520 RepID=UPI0019281A22|nr:hypothetical protein [Mesorhizobium sp. 131-3-5]BCH11992.1 hypothetical protein MesoLj131c_62500 [Mesorhizobium sp. 131-3-5]
MNMPVVQNSAGEPIDDDDDLLAAVDNALSAEADKPKRSVRTMISNAGNVLKRIVEQARKKEAELEAIKATATADYERIVADAKAVRDKCHQDTDADLFQIRTTLDVIDPARAKLAEMA